MKKRRTLLLFCLIIMTLPLLPFPTNAQQGRVVQETFHAPSLEENLLCDSPERNVVVYLPPHHEMETEKRYPYVLLIDKKMVLYFTTRKRYSPFNSDEKGLSLVIAQDP